MKSLINRLRIISLTHGAFCSVFISAYRGGACGGPLERDALQILGGDLSGKVL